MMDKLMIDSVLTWATDYKVDGFRFDLMGHQPKASMVKLRQALDRLTVRRDGVDGQQDLHLRRGLELRRGGRQRAVRAGDPAEHGGTGIGTFNDRLRDAVRGGGPFDEDPRIQGFASGLYTDPNGAAVNGTPTEQQARLLLDQDQIKVGLTGNLQGLHVRRPHRRDGDRGRRRLQRPAGRLHGGPAGGDHLRRGARQRDPVRRAGLQAAAGHVDGRPDPDADPGAVHDGARPGHVVLARRRRHPAQQVAGPQQLRLRRLVQRPRLPTPTNGFGRGLPPEADNEAKWAYMRPLLADPALDPARPTSERRRRQADDCSSIRQSTPLFHLGTARLVQQKLSFPGGGPAQTPGRDRDADRRHRRAGTWTRG